MSRIKICGLTRPQDIDYVNMARPDWCGFVIGAPNSRRNLSPQQVRQLRQLLHPSIVPVGVVVDQEVEVVAQLLNEGTIAIAQLHGQQDGTYITSLRRAAPGHPIWQVFQVKTQAEILLANRSIAERVVLDSGGGSGLPFPWELLQEMKRPYILAGGLTPQTIPQAIAQYAPYGIDLSSGVETDGVKDLQKIQAAIAAARKDGKP